MARRVYTTEVAVAPVRLREHEGRSEAAIATLHEREQCSVGYALALAPVAQTPLPLFFLGRSVAAAVRQLPRERAPGAAVAARVQYRSRRLIASLDDIENPQTERL